MCSVWDNFCHNAKQLLLCLDQLANSILGIFLFPWERYYADETVSSHSYRWDISGKRHWPRKIIDFVAARLGDKDHCYQSFVSERVGRQLPPEARG